jgi:hypothetical protein
MRSIVATIGSDERSSRNCLASSARFSSRVVSVRSVATPDGREQLERLPAGAANSAEVPPVQGDDPLGSKPDPEKFLSTRLSNGAHERSLNNP